MPGSRLVLLLVGLLGLVLGGCTNSARFSSSTPEANFTPRDRELLANPPYAQADIPEQFRRRVVDYHSREPPGTILVNSDARYLYYVMPEGKAVRYGVAVGNEALAWSGVATVGRMTEWPDWIPTPRYPRTSRPFPGSRSRRSGRSAGRAGALPVPGQDGHPLSHPRHQPAAIYRPGRIIRLHPHDQRGCDRSV